MKAMSPSPSPSPSIPLLRDRSRPHSRRGGTKVYLLERLSNQASRERKRQQSPEIVGALVEAAKTGSALRRRLVAAGIDPKLARLTLMFYGRSELRVADVAWMLGVSPSTACRLLDRAERAGLVDKLYHQIDRRGTWARLTRPGVDLRTRVERQLAAVRTNERPRGLAYGIRSTTWDWDG
jgi:DNA-binding MarR family transcriptional regulator